MGRNQLSEQIAQHVHAPRVDVAAVDVIDDAHFRAIPRMLTKKLERNV